LKGGLDRCQGKGSSPWVVTIIDYYGPGCMFKNGSKEQIAMVPDRIGEKEDIKFSFKYINLDNVAYTFSCKQKTLTLIFNHSSTEYFESEEAKKIGKEED
jgi:hypothetical protein